MLNDVYFFICQKNHTGTLDYNETEFIWKELNVWFDIFKQFDKDNSGFIESLELRRIFKSLGWKLMNYL